MRRVGSGHDLHIAVKLKQYFSSVLFVRSSDVVKVMGRVLSLQEFAFLTIVHATAVSEKNVSMVFPLDYGLFQCCIPVCEHLCIINVCKLYVYVFMCNR